jgi:hypothetical protein
MGAKSLAERRNLSHACAGRGRGDPCTQWPDFDSVVVENEEQGVTSFGFAQDRLCTRCSEMMRAVRACSKGVRKE